MYAYLTALSGPIAGNSYLLDARQQNLLGRGTECSIIVPEPRCSRVHAVVANIEGAWRLRDAESRNGTLINQERIHDVPLKHGLQFQLGTTEFEFHLCEQTPTVSFVTNEQLTQTIVRDTRVDELGNPAIAQAAIAGSEQEHDLLLLYQLSTKLLATRQVKQQLLITLNLLCERTKASVVGYLWVNDQGVLVPRYTLPASAENRLPLSEAMTRLVSDQGHAIWVANQQSGRSEHPEHTADAVCVPLVKNRRVYGALYAYLADGRFRQSEFDFAISLANITSLATARTQREQRFQQQAAVPSTDAMDTQVPWELAGSSDRIVELRQRVANLAPTGNDVLILGEPGTGKLAIARALHAGSQRREAPLYCVNCAEIPPEQFDQYLFGARERTGEIATTESAHDLGVFLQAEHATVYLSNIELLPESAQGRLLRVHRREPVMPFEGTTPHRLEVRIICSTSDQDALSQSGRMLPELVQQLGVYQLQIPAVRERREDLDDLIHLALRQLSAREGKPTVRLETEAHDLLRAANWPGNLRQLHNVLENAVLTARGDVLDATALQLSRGDAAYDTLRIDDWERRLIAEALQRTGGNVPEAAALLGVSRATLYRKIDDYKIAR